jgi:hypothetical protein
MTADTINDVIARISVMGLEARESIRAIRELRKVLLTSFILILIVPRSRVPARH